jgi:hypothetical protein
MPIPATKARTRSVGTKRQRVSCPACDNHLLVLLLSRAAWNSTPAAASSPNSASEGARPGRVSSRDRAMPASQLAPSGQVLSSASALPLLLLSPLVALARFLAFGDADVPVM